MPSLGLVYDGLRLSVSGDAACLAWLAEFLAPSFSVDAAAAGAADVSVSLVVDPDRHACVRADGADADLPPVELFALDSRVVRAPARQVGDGALRIVDGELGVAYTVDRRRGQVEILAPAADTDARVALMRVVRELAMTQAVARGRLPLHAASLAVHGRGLVLLGAKRAGKTTLLLHLLQAPAARLIANDRTIVIADAAGARATGVPSIVSLRATTLALLPAFAAQARARAVGFWHTLAEGQDRPAHRPGAEVVDFTPAQLCAALAIQAAASAPITAVLLPQVPPPDLAAVRIERLTPEAAAAGLRANVFAGGALGRQAGVFAPLPAAGGSAQDVEARQSAAIEALARAVPAFMCAVPAHVLPDREQAASLVSSLSRPVRPR